MLMRMPKVLNVFLVDNMICLRNEMLMCTKLMSHNPTFDP